MASFQNVSVLQHADTRFESPAKVFARLKSKVQREAKEDMFTDVEPLRERHGADFNSPRRRTDSAWMPSEFKENRRFSSYRNEAEALTISPISSPQKSLGNVILDLSCKPVVEMPHVTDIGHALQSRNQHTPTKRAFLESTAVFHPLVNVFTGTNRTPVKNEPVRNSCGGWMSEKECAPLEKTMSPFKRFSLMKNSLRKRKWGQQEMDKVSISTTEVCNEGIRQPKERKSSAPIREDDSHICTEDLGTERSEINQITHEPMFAQPRSITQTWCNGNLEKLPLMSPAKMFAYMMEREKRREEQEVRKVSSSTRELVDVGHYRQFRDMPQSTADSADETEDAAFRDVPESESPDNRSGLESADSQSDTEPSDVPPPAAPSQPVLYEDPLVLNSPRISIPKKNKAVFKHNKWSQHTTFPSESVIYLTKWFLRRNRKGLFIDGYLNEGNTPWNSNIIVERVSNCELKTVSGKVYILVGKMKLIADSEFPKWLLKKFANGFPPNWKELYEKFLSESRDNSRRDTERNCESRSTVSKTTPKGSAPNRTVKQHRQKHMKTPDSCVPASSSSTKLSRSGRVIKPPLEYWKGGRVMLDAHMNVTIYECYDTSICQPEVTTTVCANSQKLAQVPCSEGNKQYDSTSNGELPVLQRRVKAPLHKRNRAKDNPEEQPPSPADPPVETLSHHISSPEEWSGNIRRSSRRCPATKRTQVNSVTPSQSKPKKPPQTRKSNKQTHSTSRPSVSGSAGYPTFHNKASRRHESSSSEDEVTDNRKKRGKGAHRKVVNKPQPNRMSPTSQFSEESGLVRKRTARVTKRKPRKTSPPIKPLPKLAQSSKKHKGQNEDEWTEAEQVTAKQRVSTKSVLGRKPDGSEEDGRGNKMDRKTVNKSRPKRMSPPSQSEESVMELRRTARVTKQKPSKTSPPIKPLPKLMQSSKKHKGHKAIPREQNEDEWTEAELIKLQQAVSCYPKHMAGYWAKVAMMVGTRSTEECHNQHISQGNYQTPAKKTKKEKVEAPKESDCPVISARVGTFKRKQQVRQFLEAMPRDNVEDVFSTAYMQSKRFEIPSMCQSEDRYDALSDLEPVTPMTTHLHEAKTPQCLHITPGMMGSPNRHNGDKYVYQLQKRMKKNQFNVHKQATSSKGFTPSPTAKRKMRKCGNTENDTFAVWEMFPDQEPESGEEEDFYFSDDD